MSLAFATIRQLKEKLKNKEISPKELLDYFIKRFEKYDPKIGSALEVFNTDSILEKSNKNGSLYAIPGLIKDNICQKDRITSCGSKILENFRATYDATVIETLKAEGAFLVGRANMDEFAMGTSNEYVAFKKVVNPWDNSRVPGGSSGGSAAAVAAGLVPWALGSETGGSVRLPSAFCNLVGLKPTYGRVSRYGLIAYCSSFDQIGVFARNVYDNALIFSLISGQDRRDSTSLNVPKKDYTQNLDGELKPGLTIGIIEDALDAKGMDSEVKELVNNAIKEYEKMGVKIKRVKFPTLDYSLSVYAILTRAEAASNLARFDGVRYGFRDKGAKTLAQMYSKTRQNGFGAEVRLRIMVGNYVLSTGHAEDFYVNAHKVRQLMVKQAKELFSDVDLLLLPTQVMSAFKFGTFTDPLHMDLQDYCTAFVNIIGVPAISIPCGFTKNNLPVGLQLVGPHLSEDLIFQTAYAYEQNMPWHTMHPKELD